MHFKSSRPHLTIAQPVPYILGHLKNSVQTLCPDPFTFVEKGSSMTSNPPSTLEVY